MKRITLILFFLLILKINTFKAFGNSNEINCNKKAK